MSLLASAAWAQPTVNAVLNAASYAVPPAPNSPLARGSLFVVFGANMGPAAIAQAAYPLPTALGGTSIQVTVGGTTVNAFMVYSLAGQAAAILPSSTPAGTGTLRVNFNAQNSATIPITVVDSSPAIFTVNAAGFGDGIITFLDYGLVTPTRAARPGDNLIVWATGLGPVSFAENQPPQAGDLNVPLEVWFGNQQAQVLYKGRNPCCSALDQINIVVPPGVDGCGTQVFLKIGNIVSNAVTVAVGKPGSNSCTLNTSSFGSNPDIQAILNRGTYTFGSVSIGRSAHYDVFSAPGVPPQTTLRRSDTAGGSFSRVSGNLGNFLNDVPDTPPLGQCTIFTNAESNNPSITFQALDAGASYTVQGPNGTRTVNRLSFDDNIFYSAELGPGVPGNYLDPGRYTFTGGGGPNVGAFNASLDVPAELVWTNRESLLTVNRANGVTFNWSGGDPNGEVQISGSSSAVATVGDGVVFAIFTCRERTSRGTFAVPPYILLQLPATVAVGGVEITGSLSIQNSVSSAASATGLDFFFVGAFASTSQSASFR